MCGILQIWSVSASEMLNNLNVMSNPENKDFKKNMWVCVTLNAILLTLEYWQSYLENNENELNIKKPV